MSYHDHNGHVSQKCENILCAQHAVMAQILFQFFSAPIHWGKNAASWAMGDGYGGWIWVNVL
jgi:hypothetical protein